MIRALPMVVANLVLLSACIPGGPLSSVPGGARALDSRERGIVLSVAAEWESAPSLAPLGRRASRLPRLMVTADDYEAGRRCMNHAARACFRRVGLDSWIVISGEHPAFERALVHETVHWLEEVTGHVQAPSIRDCACWGSATDPYAYHRDPRLWSCSTFGAGHAPPGCGTSVEERARKAVL